MAGEIQLGGVTLATESGGLITLGNSVEPVSGSVIRSFFSEYNAQFNITTTAAAFSGIEIEITNPNTSDYLALFVNIAAIRISTGEAAFGGFRYSTNNFSTSSQLGSVEFYNQRYVGGAGTDSYSVFAYQARILHPTSSNYKIRPWLKSSGSTVEGNQDGNRSSSILALEIKG